MLLGPLAEEDALGPLPRLDEEDEEGHGNHGNDELPGDTGVLHDDSVESRDVYKEHVSLANPLEDSNRLTDEGEDRKEAADDRPEQEPVAPGVAGELSPAAGMRGEVSEMSRGERRVRLTAQSWAPC